MTCQGIPAMVMRARRGMNDLLVGLFFREGWYQKPWSVPYSPYYIVCYSLSYSLVPYSLEITAFLTHPAVDKNVAGATQNQALAVDGWHCAGQTADAHPGGDGSATGDGAVAGAERA